MFWSTSTLKSKLPQLIEGYTEERLDIASYRLCVGSQVYVSPTGDDGDPLHRATQELRENASFVIPAGQFGFILTEERIKIPGDAIGFISIRAGYKFRGLVNVSGFHVDPGYEGRLIYSVFNAGPGPVHLRRGEECFVIWLASLDHAEEPATAKFGPEKLSGELTERIAGGLQSFASLDAKIDKETKALEKRIVTLEKDSAVRSTRLLIFGGIVLVILGIVFRDALPDFRKPARSVENARLEGTSGP